MGLHFQYPKLIISIVKVEVKLRMSCKTDREKVNRLNDGAKTKNKVAV